MCGSSNYLSMLKYLASIQFMLFINKLQIYKDNSEKYFLSQTFYVMASFLIFYLFIIFSK